MRALVPFLAAVSLAAAPLSAAGSAPVPSHPRTASALTRALDTGSFLATICSTYTPAEIAKGIYVGSEVCLACHKTYDAWRDTPHATSMIAPTVQWTLVPQKGVLANQALGPKDDFIQGLDFNTISSSFDKYKPNAPKLSVRNGVYTITIGPLVMPVVFVLQVHKSEDLWIQYFGVRMPASDSSTGSTQSTYLSGMAYDTGRKGWFDGGLSSFYDANNKPKLGASPTVAQVMGVADGFDGKCLGCHTTGIRSLVKSAQGEWVLRPYVAVLYGPDDPTYLDYDGDGNKEILNVGCEMCHGPGSNHVLSGGSISKIVNPADLDAAGQLSLCGQCHASVKSVPNKLFPWPMKDDTMTQWYPGLGPMGSFYVDAPNYWADGKNARAPNHQLNELLKTKHFATAKLACLSCHEPHHKTSEPAQLVETMQVNVNGKPATFKVSVKDNTLCLVCHAGSGPFKAITLAMVANPAANVDTIGKTVAAHTHHPYAPGRILGLSRCTECHQPRKGAAPGAIQYNASGHTWEAISPEKTLAYQAQGGMPNTCAVSCHNERVIIFPGIPYTLNPLPVTPAGWNRPIDVKMANFLLTYYGPGGSWWNTTAPAAPAH